MTHFRISEAAHLLGVSDDTVRRWVGDGILPAVPDASGRQVVAGADLAAQAQRLAGEAADDDPVRRSARNRFTGLVTSVQIDGLMAQVELQSGPHRVVSLMSAEAARELALEVGSKATAVIKATMVVVETERENTP
ncbi:MULTISPECIES: molybdopterin-binding protein [Microbacterium]|uniref:TOBE domain-containing protein n=1 Tax=Microbacterium TaxID=33882 RepID=UPI000CFB4244|nr:MULTISPECIES: TOBE domain-containing protein [unclassified Microbacterium]PRB07480.1 MerR family transcriptional regulator [Microbacterium sp. MYb72]